MALALETPMQFTALGDRHFELRIADLEVHVRMRQTGLPYAQYNAKARAYITVRPDDVPLPVPDGAGTDTGIDPAIDHAWRVYRQAEIKARYTRIAAVTPLLAAFLDGGLTATTWHFSMHAGCGRCPCSPGLIADRALTWHGQPVDIWVKRQADLATLAS